MPSKKAKQQKRMTRKGKGERVGIMAPLPKNGGVYRFSRWVGSDNLTEFATSASLGCFIALNNSGLLTLTTSAVQQISYHTLSMAFTLGDLPNFAEFTALFERYRFESVEIVLHPFNTTSETATTAANGACGGFLHSFVDYNDVGAVTANQSSINSMRERPSYRTMNVASMKPYTWALRPRVAVPAYASTGFSGYSNMAAPWIDSISTDVEHYGMKWLFEIANASPAIQFVNFKLELRYTLSFTDVK